MTVSSDRVADTTAGAAPDSTPQNVGPTHTAAGASVVRSRSFLHHA